MVYKERTFLKEFPAIYLCSTLHLPFILINNIILNKKSVLEGILHLYRKHGSYMCRALLRIFVDFCTKYSHTDEVCTNTWHKV